MRDERRPLWEQHAEWWQREFTDGADPEYEEQILPLVDRHLAGAAGCSTSGAAKGRSRAGPPRLGAEVVGLDPTRGQIEVARERAGGPGVRAGDRPTAAVPRRLVRRGRDVPGDRAPRPDRAGHPRDRPGARARAAASSCC